MTMQDFVKKFAEANNMKQTQAKEVIGRVLDGIFEAVEEDEHGNKILHRSRTISMSSAMGEESEYYLLTEEEYQQYRNRCGGGGSGKSKSKKKKKKK